MEIKKGKVIELKYKMNFVDRIYLPAIIKGLATTMKHFIATVVFRKAYTIQYPEERIPMTKRWRGRHVLKRDEQGRERCVACFLCMYNCPAGAIYIEAEETKPEDLGTKYPTEKHAKVWNLDLNRCIFCGLCQEACPKGAIFLEDQYELAEDSNDKLIYTKEMLLEKEGGPIKFRD